MDVDKLSLLKELLRNPETRKAALQIMQADGRKEKVTLKQYKEVIVQTHCIHCESVKERVVQLAPKEHVGVVGKSGKYYEIHYKNITGPVLVHSHTQICNECSAFITNMDRGELEERYRRLLRHYTIFTINAVRIASKQFPERGEEKEDGDKSNKSPDSSKKEA